MRIAHLHWAFPPTIGGVETHLFHLFPELTKKGHKVFLLTSGAKGRKEREIWEGSIIISNELMDLNRLNVYKVKDRNFYSRVYSLFESFLDEASPDLIHAHNFHYFSQEHAEAIAELAIRRNIPLVLTAHNVWDDDLFLRLTLEIPWKKIIAVSKYIKKELTWIGIPDDRVEVVYHGIDYTLYPGNGKMVSLKPHNVILHPARSSIAKGTDTAIKALRIIKERIKDVTLILCGVGNIVDFHGIQKKEIEYFMSLAESIGISENIKWGNFTIQDMIRLYSEVNVVIYPSTFEEPFGLVTLESMASELPIVVTNVGALPEIINDGKWGYVVGRKNAGELAEKCITLLENPQLNRKLGRAGREAVLKNFTKQIMAENTLKVYEEVLGGLRPKDRIGMEAEYIPRSFLSTGTHIS
jgi:hypothetical protein